MKMKFNLFKNYVLLILLSLQLPLFAQNQGEQNKVKLKVDLVSLGENIPGLYLGKKKSKPVDALAFRYDETLRYNGDRIIQISQGAIKQSKEESLSEEDEKHSLKPLKVKDLPKIKSEGTDELLEKITMLRKENPDLVALAKVPAGSRHITILLTPAANGTYRTIVFNDDASKKPYGKMQIHNFCKHRISMKFANGKPLIINPNAAHQIKPNAMQLVNYLLSYPKKKKWKAQESNIIRVTADQQVHMIILSSKSSFFQSASGTRGGHLQVAVLRRDKSVKAPKPEDSAPKEDVPELEDGFKKK